MAYDSAAPQGENTVSRTLTVTDWECLLQWRLAALPLVVGLAVAAVFAVAAKDSSLTVSAVYGVFAAWLPTLLSLQMAARTIRLQPGAKRLLLALVVIEGVKIMLTVALLLAAPSVVAQVNWLALLAGFVVTIKAAWAVLWRVLKGRKTGKQ
ncbi:MAG: ATP synthase subunit I [Ottowia sp.]|nr:ATP synthase subunit I [Ottowia sp.]